MELKQKRQLYIKSEKLIREYDAKDIVNVDNSGIMFSDSFFLQFAECGKYFPIDQRLLTFCVSETPY